MNPTAAAHHLDAHPEQVSVLIAHEPPLLTLLSNAEEELAGVQEIYQTYLRAGSDAAMRRSKRR